MTKSPSRPMAPTTSIVVGTAGHIDHGKSSLVLALTGTDPDRLKEEKARGITIDLGFAHYSQGELNVAFVDVPGHERFVRNMLAGASGIDCVILVVAADESVMPQTREHFDVCRLLGVQCGVVVLTKCDLVDEETVELVRMETRELVEGSFLAAAPIVPVSARLGTGLGELREALAAAATTLRLRPTTGIARLPVDRTFTMRGFGTIVTGTLVSGTVAIDTELDILPACRRVKIRGLQVHGEAQKQAHAGQRVAVNLAGVDVSDLSRGDTLVKPGGLEATRQLDATLTLLPNARPLKHGTRVRFHTGTSEVMARVSIAGLVKPSQAECFPAALEPGGEAYVRVRLESLVALTRDDRFVMRAYSPVVTIGGGRVLDPSVGRARLRSAAGLIRLRRISKPGDKWEFLVAMVDEAGVRGLRQARLTPRVGLAPTELEAAVESLVSAGSITAIGSVLIAPAHVVGLRQELIGWVSAFHSAHPLEAGLSREEARERFGRRSSSEIFDLILESLIANGTLTARDHIALTSHRITLSPEEKKVQQEIEACYRMAGLSPVKEGTLAAEIGNENCVVDRIIKLLVRQRVLVRVESLLFHADRLGQLKADVAALKTEGIGIATVEIDVATFKRLFGVTRKFAIPLLGYLDRERVTCRSGNVRIVL